MSQDEIRLDRHFFAIWRAKWIIILVVALASAATWWLAQREPTMHGATALVKVGKVWKESLEDPYVTEALVNSAGFLHELAEKIDVKTSHLRRRIKAEVVIAGTRRSRYPILLDIKSNAETADEALRLAKSVTDEIVARHNTLFEKALAPYLERERLLETQLKQPGTRELQSKLELELTEVRANNVPGAVTERTNLVAPIVIDSATRPVVWRKVATVAVLSALVSIIGGALFGYLRPDETIDTAKSPAS